ncbi:MAG: T9SS C-terminal target domain-containing protein [Calditrichaeota bacterium]|nr:MAG: T9SS C-terminal target domain-containing protein [Calditrichota bacterium]
MRFGMMFGIVGWLLVLVSFSFAQDLSGLTLVAHYPLDTDSLDATGHNPPMHLVNTPFQDGGIYCNGIYIWGGQPGGSDAITPQIDSLKFRKFALQAKFKVSEYRNQPVMVGGNLWRWIGFYLGQDSTIIPIYNDFFGSANPTIRYSLNTFHTITVVYDSTAGMGKWYLDGTLIDSVAFQIQHGNDKNVSVTHYGIGETFKGIFDDLRVYSEISGPTGIAGSPSGTPSRFDLAQNYPNPFNPATTIRYTLLRAAHVRLEIFNSVGQRVATLVDEHRPAGDYTIRWDAQHLPAGIYFYRIRAEAQSVNAGQITGSRETVFTLTRKMLLIK